MQKKALIPLFGLIIVLGGCGGSKRSTKRINNDSKVDMQVASGQKPKVSFFDESVDDIQTFVLDDETSDDIKAAIDNKNPSLVWQEPTNVLEEEKLVLYFEYDSCKPRSDQKGKIPAIKAQIDEWLHQGYEVAFKGHTCKWHGTPQYNLTLSNDRAYESAASIFGVANNSHVKTFGVGNEEPIVFDYSKDAQAANRRVEIYPLTNV